MNEPKESKFIVAASLYFYCDCVLAHDNFGIWYSFIPTDDLYNGKSIMLFDSKNEADYYMQKRLGLSEDEYHVFNIKHYFNYRKGLNANK